MKKFLSIILLISIILSSFTFTVFAEDEIIITTSDALCKLDGDGWTESTNKVVAGPTDGTSWYNGAKSASVTYDASKLQKGSYGVYLFVTPWGSTADKVDVSITASGKETTVTTDGLDGGLGNRHWLFLGKYDFDGNAADKVVQKINASASAGTMRASGVKFIKDDANNAAVGGTETDGVMPSVTPAPENVEYTTVPESGSVVMGTTHKGFSQTGSWLKSGLVMPAEGKGYYTVAVGDSAVWYPFINKAENVEIFYFKPNATATEDPSLQIEIFTDGEVKTLSVDFTQPPTEWFSLGKYNFSGDGSEYIKVTKTNPSGTARVTCLKFSLNEENEKAVEGKSAFLGTDLHILERMGMLIGEGNGITEDYIKTVPTRVQAAIMVLRLNGVDAEAAAYAGTDNFADSSLEAWAMPYLAYLKTHKEFGLEGTGNNMFEPTAKIDEQSYAKILLTALGYTINEDFTWDNTLSFAKEKGIASAKSGAFNVKDLAIMTTSALKLNCKDGVSLLSKIVEKRDGIYDEGITGTVLPEDLLNARSEAKNKNRGIIYNNDGNDAYKPYDNYPGAFDTSNLDGSTINAENFLKTRSYGLSDTQVGTVFYCTGVFNSYTHTSTGITDVRVRDWSNRLKEFTGKDSLETMVDYIHSLDKDIFWSMRMNDVHDAAYEEDELDPWKQKNMDLLMYRKNEAAFMAAGQNKWTAVDYTLKPVRQLVYDVLKDTLTRYDIDGLELDLTRVPLFFKEVSKGIEVYPENVERMNNLVRAIRDLTEKVSIERGKPILLAINVPNSLAYCKATGLDIKTWLEEGLIDIASIGDVYGLWQSWEDSIKEYDGYDTSVYAVIDEIGFSDKENRDEAKEAAIAYAAGAKGIYLYNYFNVNDKIFDTLGSPETCGPVDPSYKSQLAKPNVGFSFVKNAKDFLKY